jgi:hypothetical protein
MGTVGNSFDNAMAESCFRRSSGSWSTTNTSRRAPRPAPRCSSGWSWYNVERLHSVLKYRPPVDYEQHSPTTYIKQHDCPPAAGCLGERLAPSADRPVRSPTIQFVQILPGSPNVFEGSGTGLLIRVRDTKRRDVITWKAGLPAELASQTVGDYRQTLGIDKPVELGLAVSNPVRRVKRPRFLGPPERLALEESRRLFARCGWHQARSCR